MSLENRWRASLTALTSLGRHRQLTPPRGLDFSSNDYLGHGKANPLTASAALGRSGNASRLLRGHLPIWDEVETALAHWHGAEAALMFTSGYVANEGLLATVLGPGDWVASDQANHASIIDGLRLSKAQRFIFRHNDVNHLESALRSAPAQGQRFLVVESIFGMDGDRAPLGDLVELAERFHARMIVDEAHATGCFGATGSGLVDALGLRNRVLATVHTGGKALGVMGGYIAGSRLLRDYLVNQCRQFIFTTALPPVVGRWWLDALARIDEPERQRLHANARVFRSALSQQRIEASGGDYIVPIILGDDARAVAAANFFQEARFDVRAIRPPTVPEGTARLRVSIHADHELDQLHELAALIGKIGKNPLQFSAPLD